MDVRFLKEISEAYIIDTGTNIPSVQIYNELYEIVKYIQKNDQELYEELYDATKITQQKILKTYLDGLFEMEIICEDPLTLAVTGLTTLVLYLYRKGITRGIMNVASEIGKAYQYIGDFLSRRGKYMQLRYSIIQENYKKCYARCKIEVPSDISALSYGSISTSTTFATKKSAEQGACLRECYLENLIETICLHMEGYFACLKRTGNFAAIQNSESDDIMKMIASTNIGTACSDYYSLAKKALGDFYKVLDLVYNDTNEDDKKLEWVNKLRGRLYQTRQQVQKYDNNQLQKYEYKGNRPH